MTVSRGYHSQFTLSDGRVFTLGGSWVDGPVGNKFAEVFNPQTNQWSRKPGIDAVASVNTEDVVGFYRSDNHMWFYESTNGKILHVGPSKTMHWFNISGNGTVEVIG
jgi:galactose oxidase